MKYLFILLSPLISFANLTYESNHHKELSILQTFDIEPSFLHDPMMNKMRDAKRDTSEDTLFFNAMNNAFSFIPSVKNVLAQNDLPQEFIYLAMAESNFKTKAYSRKKASGLWQFMPRTGKRYDLKIDEYVDERRDLIKSTTAAAKYLKRLRKRFGKWYLAAIAYNCGEGRLSNAIKKAGSNKLSVLLDLDKKYIPRESRNYIRKIIALALVGTDEKFMLQNKYEHLLNRANAYSVAPVDAYSGDSLKRIAGLLDMPLENLEQLNRHLKYDFIPPYGEKYRVYIPYKKLSIFKQKYAKTTLKNIYKVHIVTSGDNLSYIGRKYGVSYRMIKDFNNLAHNRLKLKQKLIIPMGIAQKIKNLKKIKDEKSKKLYHYKVRSGDSLGSISESFQVSVKDIKSLNNINGSLIKIGDRLKLYEKITKKHHYKVRSGDSLGSISESFKVSVKDIKSLNNISGSLIKIGDRLKLYE